MEHLKKLAYLIEFLSFAFLIYYFTDIYWTLAILGFTISYIIINLKISKHNVLILFIYTLGFIGIIIGGGVLMERNFGASASYLWIVFFLILFVFSISKLISKTHSNAEMGRIQNVNE